MTGEFVIAAENLHYRYEDGTEALKGISLAIKRSQTTAIIGGNGAGKSTLFLALNGIIKPTSGRLLLDGSLYNYSRSGINELRRSVGIVFQDPDNQLFSASVFQDISFGPMNLKLPEAEIRKRVEEALVMTGVEHLRDKPTHCLSYGQKKRVAIAGVLAMEPKVLVLDEPTAGLDPMGVSELMKLLRAVQVKLGITVIISTHDIDIVPLYCDWAYAMDQGRIVLEGTPQQVFAESGKLRSIHLRIPRVQHLMEILAKEDSFEFDEAAITISEARKVLKRWRDEKCEADEKVTDETASE